MSNVDEFKLYTLAEVVALFIDAKKATAAVQRSVESEVLRSGYYLKLGDEIRLTRPHLQGFLNFLSARTVQTDPADDEEGVLVVLGSRIDSECPVFVGWSRMGGVEALAKSVQDVAAEPADFITAKPKTYGEYKKELGTLRAAKIRGKWHARTPEVLAYVQALSEQENTGG